MIARIYARKLLIRLIALTLGLLLTILLAIFFFAGYLFNREFRPEIQSSSYVVADVVGIQIMDAVNIGIPFRSIVGMPEFLAEVIRRTPTVDYVVVTDEQNHPVFQIGTQDPDAVDGHALVHENDMRVTAGHFDTVALMHDAGGTLFGGVHVGMPRRFVERHMWEILPPTLTMLLVSLLIAAEVILIAVALYVRSPIETIQRVVRQGLSGDLNRCLPASGEAAGFARAFNALVQRLYQQMRDLRYEAREIRTAQVDPNLAHAVDAAIARVEQRLTLTAGQLVAASLPDGILRVRMLLFLSILAETLTVAFLPLHVLSLDRSWNELPQHLIAGLPLAIFLIVGALMWPVTLWLRRTWDVSRMFLAGGLISSISFVGRAFAPDLDWFLAFHALGAAGYAVITVTSQGYLSRARNGGRTILGTSVIAGGLGIAAVCGPPVGGILAHQLGLPAVFLVGACLTLLTVAVSTLVLEPVATEELPADRAAQDFMSAAGALLSHRALLALTLGTGIPATLILAGLLFYLVPLFLDGQHHSTLFIGQAVMLYGLVTLALGPFAARVAARLGGARPAVIAGGILSGLALLVPSLLDGTVAMVTAVAGVALAHALSQQPQTSMVRSLCGACYPGLSQDAAVEAYRAMERLGSGVGVAVLALLAGWVGLLAASAAAALLAVAGALAYAVYSVRCDPECIV